jgi:hypothetical protein
MAGVYMGSRWLTFYVHTKVHAQSAARDFTIKEVELDGGGVVRKKSTLRIRSDGATSVSLSAPGSNLAEVLTMITFPDGRVVRSIPTLKILSTTSRPVGSSGALVLPQWTSDCRQLKAGTAPVGQVLRSDQFLGRTVFVVDTANTLTNGSNRQLDFVHWRSPELGCISLKSERYGIGPDGSKKVLSVELATEITEGIPDPDYFSVPADFKEVPPSEIENSWAKSVGLAISEPALMELKREDRRYEAQHKGLH